MNVVLLSANIVGYAGSPACESGGYKGVISTFVRVDGTTPTLGDITPVDPEGNPTAFGTLMVQLLNENGGTATIDETTMKDFDEDAYDEFGGESLEFSYRPKTKTWYISLDEGYQYPMNDYPIPLGTGLLIATTGELEEGGNLQFSGQVYDDYILAPCESAAYALSGNAAPKAMTLGDFRPVSSEDDETETSFGTFMVQFLNSNGGTATIDETTMKDFDEDAYDEFGGESLEFSYRPKTKTWYISLDEGYQYPMNAYPVPLGEGLLLATTGELEEGGKLILPPAIEKQ